VTRSGAAARTMRAAGRLVPRRLRPRVARALGAAGFPRSLLPEWEYVPEGWARADADGHVRGWGVPAVADDYRAKLAEYVRLLESPGPLAVSTSALLSARESVREHNAVVTFGYALALAARGRAGLSVLDWGGGVGIHYHLGRALVPGLELDYHVKELPAVCAAGREIAPHATFYEDESCLGRGYDLVMASSSLQYSERWQEALAGLARAAAAYLFVTRAPVVLAAPSYVVLQRAYAYGLDTEYLSWVVNREELVGCAEAAGLALAREFLIGLDPEIPGVPERQQTRAYLFRRPVA
jgi:putative methyltransferase (TIGR04325 family)